MPEPLSSEFDERRELERLQAALAARLVYPDRPIGGLGLEASEMDRAAETLVRKRISQTRGLLPRSVELLGKEYRKSFREFARSHHFDGHRAILIDAERFAGWMLASARDKSRTVPIWSCKRPCAGSRRCAELGSVVFGCVGSALAERSAW